MHKPFKKIDLDNTSAEQPALEPEEKHSAMKYGERIEVINVPYPGQIRSINCTVNAAELQHSLTKQKEDCTKTVAQNAEYRRVPKGARTLKRLQLDDADKPETTRIDR